MANTKSAAKRARQTEKRTAQNRSALSTVKSKLKKARTALAGSDKEKAKAVVSEFASAIDKAAKSGRVHRNAANRQKSKLKKALAKLA